MRESFCCQDTRRGKEEEAENGRREGRGTIEIMKEGEVSEYKGR